MIPRASLDRLFECAFWSWEAPINSIDFYKELHQWVYQMWKELPPVDAICNVAERMYKATGEERHLLAGELRNLLIINGDYQEALQVLDMMIEEYPDEVGPHISKASLYLYHFDDLEKALRCIDLALELASRTGHFRRHACGYKARILLELGRGQQLSDVLEEIMSLRIKKGVSDIGRERDFIDRAPPGVIREDVLARYNQFRPKRPTDTTANEPPKYERADDWE
jgi:tetratricopeptide (TPR) repeat protein